MHNGSKSDIRDAALCAVQAPVSGCRMPRKGDGSGWLSAGAPRVP